MEKKRNFGLNGLLFLSVLAMLGCATGPAFDSLPPEPAQSGKVLVGSWVSNDAMVSESYGSLVSVKGRQFYVFYDDGTGEIVDYNGDTLTNRRVFKYRLSDTLIGFQFLQGTLFTNGGSFTRPYALSPDGRQITFPEKSNGLFSTFMEFSMVKTDPPPPLPPPPPEPEPEPEPAPLPKVNNAGQIYYSYDGTGYVYKDNNVFYLCSDGKPVGYVDGTAIYAFDGKALGFVEKSWIYNLKGLPKGALDPKSMGLDAAAKKPVTKANKQDLPEKQKEIPADKPRLRNGYFGGVLQEIFS